MSRQKPLWDLLYSSVDQESQLLWHNEEIPDFLTRTVKELGGKGKALDIGCGTGVFAVYMAQNGLEVTALDFARRALDFARRRAEKSGVKVNFIHTDLFEWKTAQKYDLVFDSGCLHSIKGRDRERYKEQILKWLSPEGTFLLIHCGRKYFITLNIRCPIRKTQQEIKNFFLPELQLKESYRQGGRASTLFYYRFNPA